VATAVASLHLVEQRVQSRKTANWLTPRRLIWVLPMVLALGIGTVGAAVKTPAPAAWLVRNKVLLVGDSVPSRLFPAFDEVAYTRG
jgi:hypothetical protein